MQSPDTVCSQLGESSKLIDIISVVLVNGLCSACVSIALALAIDWQRDEYGARWWVAGFAGIALAFFSAASNHLVSPAISHGLSGVLLLGGFAGLAIGLKRFLGLAQNVEAYTVACLAAGVLVAWAFLAVWPNPSARIGVNTLLMAALLSLLTYLALQAPEQYRSPARLMAAVVILMVFLLVARAVRALLGAPLSGPFDNALANTLTVVSSSFGLVAVGLSCYQMVMIRRSLHLEVMSVTDPLTGALNRRGLEIVTSRVEHDYRRSWRVFSVIAIDLDHFKIINDTHGHAAGDQVLRRLVEECRRNLRGDSVVARMGGEEFCVVLPDCRMADAMTVAERIRASFAEAYVTMDAASIGCTISLGVAQCHEGATDFAAVAKLADAALYRAKFAGRNRVEAAPLT